MFLARIVRHFKECHLIIEAKVVDGHKKIFFVCRHLSDPTDLCRWVFTYDNLEKAEACLFEFAGYPEPIFKERSDGVEIENLLERFKLAKSSTSSLEWIDVSCSPFLEKCFALSVVSTESLFVGQ